MFWFYILTEYLKLAIFPEIVEHLMIFWNKFELFSENIILSWITTNNFSFSTN